jgi:hypothetical protein
MFANADLKQSETTIHCFWGEGSGKMAVAVKHYNVSAMW